jgi:hypothetical protein
MSDTRTDRSSLPLSREDSQGGGRNVRRSYVLVLAVEAIVLAALWLLQASFNA